MVSFNFAARLLLYLFCISAFAFAIFITNRKIMEPTERGRRNIFAYIAYAFLALGAFVIIRYFTRPTEADLASIKDMNMFIQNAIYETDQKMKTDSVEEDVASWITWYKSSAALYNDAKNNKDKDIKQQSKVLKDHLLKVQIHDFPELRKTYTAAKKEVLSRKNIAIEASGATKDTLTLTSELFESAKQKKEFLRSINGIAKDLRFKKVVFKWSDKQGDISDYDIASMADGEI